MHKLKVLLISCCVGALSGCLSPDVVKLDSTLRNPNPIEFIDILLEEPSHEYTTIARIQADASTTGLWKYEQQTKSVVEEAAFLGADAVIIHYGSEVVGVISNSNELLAKHQTGNKGIVGLAIIYD